MRDARAVVEGDGWRGPRCLRREDGGGCGFVGLGCWWVLLGGGFGGESGAGSRMSEIWASAEARGWPVGARLGFWVVVVFGVEDP